MDIIGHKRITGHDLNSQTTFWNRSLLQVVLDNEADTTMGSVDERLRSYSFNRLRSNIICLLLSRSIKEWNIFVNNIEKHFGRYSREEFTAPFDCRLEDVIRGITILRGETY